MEQLDWLPRHPDLRGAIAAARKLADAQDRLAAAIALAGHRRDFVATDQLARLADAAATVIGGLDRTACVQLTPVRVAVLASHTVDHLLPAARVAGLQRRLALATYVAPYGMLRQALLARASELAAFAPQFVVIASDANDAAFDVPIDTCEAAAEQAVGARVEELRALWRGARRHYSAQVIQQTFVAMVPPLFGSYEGLVPGAPTALLERLNNALRAAAREDGVLLLDLAWHARRSGTVFDPVRWHQAKQLVSPVFAPCYGDLLARVVAAAVGCSRKCLVLDLDNTLWGGVVGDDGPEGIQLGNGSPAGEAFLAFQRYAAQLARRGVVLAICSKNDPRLAEEVFSSHPEMALRCSDIACFVANWDDKATNLRRIARSLELGRDSFVFVDDNPVERDIVRRELPEVAVPELPDDVALYPAMLAAAGYFEPASFTREDAGRSRSYAANAERRSLQEGSTDIDGFLRSLDMKLVVTAVGSMQLQRAAQLINKSNQFNLTTRRYTEAQLADIAAQASSVALCLRLVDRFGDNGLIGVLIARPDADVAADELLIDSWLMSCRVLGRQVEVAALQVLAAEAARRGAAALVGEYRPTPRNALVADHYAKLGFEAIAVPATQSNGVTRWRYDIEAAPPLPHHIQLEVDA